MNQSCSALVYSGLQTLTAVGLHVMAPRGMKQAAIITGCTAAGMPPDWGGTLFRGDCALPQFVKPSVVQSKRLPDPKALTLVKALTLNSTHTLALILTLTLTLTRTLTLMQWKDDPDVKILTMTGAG